MNRQQIINELRQIAGYSRSKSTVCGEAADLLERDAVEVVRCDDCKYAKPYDRADGRTGYYCQHPNSTFLYGANWERIFEPVRESKDFCSYGKKKDAKEDGTSARHEGRIYANVKKRRNENGP